jgi:hypothetical protein
MDSKNIVEQYKKRNQEVTNISSKFITTLPTYHQQNKAPYIKR